MKKKLTYHIFSLFFGLFCLCGWSIAAELSSVTYDTAGRLKKIQSLTLQCGVSSRLALYPLNWKNPSLQDSATRMQVNQPGVELFKGQISLGQQGLDFLQASKINGDTLELYLDVVPNTNVKGQGLYWLFYVDAAAFEGGRARIFNLDKKATLLPFPQQASRTAHVVSKVYCRGIELQKSSGNGVYFDFKKPKHVELQDLRGFGDNRFAVFVPVAVGNLVKGRRYTSQMNIQLLENVPDQSYTFSVSEPEHPFVFEGVGGNYCFQLGSPVTTQTLKTLVNRRARVEMSLHLWEPNNDNADPLLEDIEHFAMREKESAELREEFAMAKTLADRGIPLVISVWHIPQWMYAGASQEDKYISARPLRVGIIPELVEGIVSYLRYMRDNYQVEPELFSFNEPDLGIYVLQSAQEHAEFIKTLGKALNKAGLKTKFMLGDNASYARCPDYWMPALQDKEARGYIGAMSYHTWGVPSASYMRLLGEVSRKYEVPLIIGEVGTDPEAYKNHDYFHWEYALGEIRLMQNLMNYSRAKSLLYWEFTGDYPLFKLDRDLPVATKRYWLMRQYCNWLPESAVAQKVKGGDPGVSLVAFYGKNNTITLHLANLLKRQVEVEVKGLPADIEKLIGVVSGRDDNYRLIEGVQVHNGVLKITLPAQSLTTLARRLPVEQVVREIEGNAND